MQKILIGCLVTMMGLGMGWGISLIERQPHGKRAIAPSDTSPAIEFRGVNLSEFSGGAKQWDLKAREVRYDVDRKQAFLEQIEARFWENGQVVSTARSPMAALETGSRNLVLKGGIQVISSDADTRLSAQEVEWVAASESLHASGDVAFQRGPSRLAGPQLWADRSLRRVKMGSLIQARVQMDTGWK